MKNIKNMADEPMNSIGFADQWGALFGTPVESSITVKRLTGAIGAEMHGVNLQEPIDEATFSAVHRALLDHSMLVFRGQFISPAAQVSFTQLWGDVMVTPYLKPFTLEYFPMVYEVRNMGKANALTEEWHSDSSFLPNPPSYTILVPKDVPELGGDTMFASQYLAYERLSDGMKRMLDGVRAFHRGTTMAAAAGADDSGEKPQSHPVVRTHPDTGRKALYVNRMYTTHFDGMTRQESKGLLEFLLDHCHRPDFTYRHQWSSGDVVIWDNRCTIHYAVHDYGNATRDMHRTTIVGDIPK